jgi:Flp pilus assembly protein TadD
MGQGKHGDAEQALLAEAQDAFRRAVAPAAGSVDAQNGLGHALFKLGATQEAKAQWPNPQP